MHKWFSWRESGSPSPPFEKFFQTYNSAKEVASCAAWKCPGDRFWLSQCKEVPLRHGKEPYTSLICISEVRGSLKSQGDPQTVQLLSLSPDVILFLWKAKFYVLPPEGTLSPSLSLSTKTLTPPRQRTSYALLRLDFEKKSFSPWKLRILEVMLSSLPPVLPPVLYCYIHSRTHFIWVISLGFSEQT